MWRRGLDFLSFVCLVAEEPVLGTQSMATRNVSVDSGFCLVRVSIQPLTLGSLPLLRPGLPIVMHLVFSEFTQGLLISIVWPAG